MSKSFKILRVISGFLSVVMLIIPLTGLTNSGLTSFAAPEVVAG